MSCSLIPRLRGSHEANNVFTLGPQHAATCVTFGLRWQEHEHPPNAGGHPTGVIMLTVYVSHFQVEASAVSNLSVPVGSDSGGNGPSPLH